MHGLAAMKSMTGVADGDKLLKTAIARCGDVRDQASEE
jgi:hypothetical protein